MDFKEHETNIDVFNTYYMLKCISKHNYRDENNRIDNDDVKSRVST